MAILGAVPYLSFLKLFKGAEWWVVVTHPLPHLLYGPLFSLSNQTKTKHLPTLSLGAVLY